MLVLLLVSTLLLPATEGDGGRPPPNILFLIADDVGVDRIRAYGEHPAPGKTPVLDALAAHGLLFRNAWSAPVCSPSRAWMLTGRRAASTGLGISVKYDALPFELDPELLSLPDVARQAGLRTAALGKWHLSSALGSGLAHPLALGFEEHRGTPGGFVEADGPGIYFDWIKTIVDGSGAVQVPVAHYATSETVDDALERIDAYGDEPWLLWTAFHAPHQPLHPPPDHLHDYDLPQLITESQPKHFKAVMQALDTEIGRLLVGIRPAVLARTVIVFVGDNGTPPDSTTAPFLPEHGKSTVYEGGVNVPLILAGPGVPAGVECQGLVQLTDLFATVAELLEVPVPPRDGISLLPYLEEPTRPSLRRWVHSERFTPNGDGPWEEYERCVREARFKLLRRDGPEGRQEELYDLSVDLHEEHDLLASGALEPEAAEALQRLSALLDDLDAGP